MRFSYQPTVRAKQCLSVPHCWVFVGCVGWCFAISPGPLSKKWQQHAERLTVSWIFFLCLSTTRRPTCSQGCRESRHTTNDCYTVQTRDTPIANTSQTYAGLGKTDVRSVTPPARWQPLHSKPNLFRDWMFSCTPKKKMTEVGNENGLERRD